jgi:hypothetical protein
MRIAKINKVEDHGITPEEIFEVHENYRVQQK